jgi:hypothetical protein
MHGLRRLQNLRTTLLSPENGSKSSETPEKIVATRFLARNVPAPKNWP